MDKLLLKGLLFLVRLFAVGGIDSDRLQIILETKLLMDRRRPRANYSRQKNKEPKNPLLITLALYSFFGLMMALLIAFTSSLILSMILFHAYLLFMMSMTLITDFSSVLLDTTDNDVITPRPVNSRTVFLARLLHVLVYLLQFTIALGIFPLIAVFITYGLTAGFMAIFTILLTVGLAVFITYLLYILILRFGNEQKVKDIIAYFQIFMTLLFTAGYQLVPRLIDYDALVRTFSLHWYSYWLPPVWMAVSIEAFREFDFDGTHLLMILLAFTVPVVTFWLMIKYLAPSFARKLAIIQNSHQQTTTGKARQQHGRSISAIFSKWLCRSGSEKAGFEFVWKITGRDKGFKMQFYPGLGYILIFAFIIVFKSGKDIHTTMATMPQSELFLWLIYLPVFMVSSSIRIINTSENYQAAWLYYSAPIKFPGSILSGALKALLTKFFMPVFLIMFAFALFIWGPAIVDDFIFGFFNNLIIFLLIQVFSDHFLPFSQQQNIKVQSGRFAMVILQFAVIALLVGLHYLALKINWLVAGLVLPAATAQYFLIKKIASYRWKDMKI